MLENCKARGTHYKLANTDECLIEYCVLPTKRNTLRLVLALPSAFMYFLLAILLVIPSSAGINKKLVVKPDTPDGNFLDLIGLETDFDKRVALIEQFTIFLSHYDHGRYFDDRIFGDIYGAKYSPALLLRFPDK